MPDSGRFVIDVLLESRLVRVLGALPAERPDRSAGGRGAPVGYAVSNPDGDDGAPLTDYDVIGSARHGTGLFALDGISRFNLLCIPPLAREQDVACRRCWWRREFAASARLCCSSIPRRPGSRARAALDALRIWPFRSDSAVMYFPRVQAFDRLRGRVETFGPVRRCRWNDRALG